MRIPEGVSASARNALRVLREAGLLQRYGDNNKVVLACRHIVIIDAPVKQGGRYLAYCPPCDDWQQIARKATATEKIGGRFNGSEILLWQSTEETQQVEHNTPTRDDTSREEKEGMSPDF